MIILIDCDDVLADFTTMFQELVLNQFGIKARASDGETWDIFEYPEVKDLKDEIWKYLLETPGLIRGISKFSYANELIGRLRELGEVICCTATVNGLYWTGERINWLVEEMSFDRKDIIFAHKKDLVWGDVLIDDKPANVQRWADRWYKKGGLGGLPVFWQPPNRDRFPFEDNRALITGSVDDLIYGLKYWKDVTSGK